MSKRWPVQKLSYSLFGIALLALPHAAQAEQYFGYGIEKSFLQSSSKGPDFDGGRFAALLRDGNAVYLAGPCANNGSLEYFPPSLACPLGGTGIISSGFVFEEGDGANTVDEDGIQADNTYWQIINPVPATKFEPFVPELCKLLAAPASDLPRPMGGFEERGLLVFYNRVTLNPYTDYSIARYELERPYGSWPADDVVEKSEGSRMSRECVPGQYVFQFPKLGAPELPLNLLVRINPFLEAYNSSSSAGKQGFKFLGNRWDTQGYYQLDPRLVHDITWQGTKGKLFLTDEVYFSIEGDDDDITDEFDANYFPPNGGRIRILTQQPVSYKLPPGFFEIGETGMLKLDFQRRFAVTAIASDVSSRQFKTRVRFIDSYSGFATYGAAFRSTISVKDRAATADADKDGFNNVTEFAMESNPADPAITAIASTPTTFMVTAINHGLTAGDTVLIAGATPAGYNGTWTVASSTADTFTVNSNINLGAGQGGLARMVSDSPVNILSIVPETNPDITDLDFVPSYFIITTTTPHGKVSGQQVVVQGALPAGYNGIWTAGTVTPTTIRVNVDTTAGAGTGGTLNLYLVGQLDVFNAEVSIPNYIRTHAGNVITIGIAKRPDVGTSVTYGLETKATEATKKWTKIKFGSTWQIVAENDDVIWFQSDGTVPLDALIRPTATLNF